MLANRWLTVVDLKSHFYSFKNKNESFIDIDSDFFFVG